MGVNGEAPSEFTVRVMSYTDLERTMDWAAAEGWNPGLDDADIFHSTDPDGFFAGYLGGEHITSLSVIAYELDFAFLGFYIVPPEHRGLGYGLRTWQAAVSQRPAQLAGLDGVVEQQENYVRSGFQLAYRNIRYGGVVAGAASPYLIAASAVPFDRIAAYDRQFFPAARPAFLSRWIRPRRGAALVALDNNRITGLGVIRACREGFKIGPLYGDSDSIAESLFLGLAQHAQGEPIFLDVPAPNEAAVRLAERYGLVPSFETARMYTGTPPDIALPRLFGVTTFELG